MSLTQIRVMGILRDRKLRVTQLADYLGLEKSAVSGLVARAEQRGLVERTRASDDGRAVVVTLTAAGREAADGGAARLRRALAPQASVLTPAERRRLRVLQGRLQAGELLVE